MIGAGHHHCRIEAILGDDGNTDQLDGDAACGHHRLHGDYGDYCDGGHCYCDHY